jgi:hypothetical protein
LYISPDRRLDLGPLIVAAGLLPGHLAAIGDHLQMPVALVGAVSAEVSMDSVFHVAAGENWSRYAMFRDMFSSAN